MDLIKILIPFYGFYYCYKQLTNKNELSVYRIGFAIHFVFLILLIIFCIAIPFLAA
jgi:hypothetical protein